MQTHLAANETDREAAGARSRGAAEAAGPTARKTAASRLLGLQRTHGNRYVRRVLGASALRPKCACGGTCGGCRSKAALRELALADEVSQSAGPEPQLARDARTYSDFGLGLGLESGVGHDFRGLTLQKKCGACDEEERRRRELTGGHDSRCHIGEDCPDDDLADYQGSGVTTCNKSTGNMDVTVTEHCSGDCVRQHENVHVADRGACCRNVKKCIDNAGADAARAATCRSTYDTWHPQLSDFTECNAYTREVSCLTSLIAGGCGADAGAAAIPAACCTTLNTELAFATRQRTAHCAAANNVACPIAADGSIP